MKPSTRLYDFCSCWTVLTFIVIALLMWNRSSSLGGLSFAGVVLQLILAIVGMVGAVTSLVMFIGMSVDVLKTQRYSGGAKAAWMVLFFLALPVGAVFYYLLVFRRAAHSLAG